MSHRIVISSLKLDRLDFVKQARADGAHIHEVIIAIRQHNVGLLEKELRVRSKPRTPLYQNWLTFEEIQSLTKNDEVSNNTVLS